MKAAQKLLGAPVIGGGVPGQGWRWSELKEANKPPHRLKYQKTVPKMAVSTLFGLKIAENTVSCSKVLNKIYSQDFFEECINLKIFC